MLLKYDEIAARRLLRRPVGGAARKLKADSPDQRSANVIVPVPLPRRPPARTCLRPGRDDRPLAKRLGLKVRPYLLARTKPRPPRLILSRTEHWNSVSGAWRRPRGPSGRQAAHPAGRRRDDHRRHTRCMCASPSQSRSCSDGGAYGRARGPEMATDVGASHAPVMRRRHFHKKFMRPRHKCVIMERIDYDRRNGTNCI
jgi:hypothetical protein